MNLNLRQIQLNKLAYYLMSADLTAMLIFSIFAKWTDAGMDFSQILLLQGIFGLFMLLLEFPSGVLADLTQRKLVLSAGYIAILVAVVIYAISTSFLGFLLAELAFAIGFSLKSGTNTAFIYDTYLDTGDEEEADEIIANGKTVAMSSALVSFTVGGYLTSIDRLLPYLVVLLVNILVIFLLTMTHEPSRHKAVSSNMAVRKAMGYLSNSRVFQALLLAILSGVTLRVAFWAYIPKMENAGLAKYWFGLVLAGANMISLFATRLAKKYKDSDMVQVLVPTVIIGTFLIIFDHLSLLFVAIFLHQIGRGSISVLVGVYLNREVDSDVRSSIGSLVSSLAFSGYFLFTLMLNIGGLSMNNILGLNTVLALILGIGALVLQYLHGRFQRQPSNRNVQLGD